MSYKTAESFLLQIVRAVATFWRNTRSEGKKDERRATLIYQAIAPPRSLTLNRLFLTQQVEVVNGSCTGHPRRPHSSDVLYT